MEAGTVVILGIAVDNLDMDETVERIFEMVESYESDGRPKQVATVNVDFIVNTLTWGLKKARHPELLDILRRTDLVTADGMPIVWTSKLLGTPLKARVAGSDLVPLLARKAAERGKSLYFLGGKPGSAEKAADILKQANPGLKIAGIGAPYVHIDGLELADSEESDRAVSEEINRSQADILLIAFGNPKQEIWFDRNRSRLKVPVSIGIGGTFEFIAGSVSRAPKWMQKTGTEWIFRIGQDPKRLWKRYFTGFFKFGLLIWPAVLHVRFRRFLYLWKNKRAEEPDAAEPERGRSPVEFRSVRLPKRFDAAYSTGSGNRFGTEEEEADLLILDFGDVDFIDSTGLGFLVAEWRRRNRDGKKLRLVGVRPPAVRFFKLSRLWDIFGEIAEESMDDALAAGERAKETDGFPYRLRENAEHVLFEFSGSLNADRAGRVDTKAFYDDFKEKDAIFDLTRLKFSDSTGLGLFVKALKHQRQRNKALILFGLQDSVRQLFRITKLENLFMIAEDIDKAKKRLEALR